MVLKINHNELGNLLKSYYQNKLALFIIGTFGIGKSEKVRDTAVELSILRDREFVDWNRITKEMKVEIINNPKKYFVLIDLRLSEFDAGDMKLPDFKQDSDTFEWKIPLWAKLLTLDDSDGILFLDEFNLATPLVISSCYKLIYDRCIDSHKISDNWLIIGAGNKESDHAYTHQLPAPVLDRGGQVELEIPNSDDWITWAIDKKLDSRIIAFISFKPSNLYKVNYNDEQKHTTNRGWFRLNRLTNGLPLNDTFELLCKSAISEGVAIEYISFCKISEKMNLDKFIEKPEKIKDISDISVKYLLVSSLSERYTDDKIAFSKIMEISEVFDKLDNGEFVALLWRLCKSYTEKDKKFEKDFMKDKRFDKFIEKYSKYIVKG